MQSSKINAFRYRMCLLAISVFLVLTNSQNLQAQFFQQGPKLKGLNNLRAQFGGSVSISGDGNTAVVGGREDNNNAGAVWIFGRINGVWQQQGPKIIPSGTTGSAQLGCSVAISADGNTIIAGGLGSNITGAAWIFTKVNGIWQQQGGRLFGAGMVGNALFGIAVSLSADGNTAVVGASNDNSGAGAIWVFTRSGNTWTQSGNKLVCTGGTGSFGPNLGHRVSIAADGNTIAASGNSDNDQFGAVWIFVRSGGTWSQQGAKLVGSGAIRGQYGLLSQGESVCISGNGNTVIFGSPYDNYSFGAAWVFSRNAGIWSQQGSKLIGMGAAPNNPYFPGTVLFGMGVSISSDGNKAIVGGEYDNAVIGATWVFTRSGNIWTQQGTKLVGTSSAMNQQSRQGCSVALSADGSTIITGGYYDGVLESSNIGAAWVFFTGPTITSFSPAASAVDEPVIIKGTGFLGTTAVSFGGTPATSFIVTGDTSISAIVGITGSAGNVSVTTNLATASKAGFTIAAPVITDINPMIAGAGATVTITGNNLKGATIVRFGGTAATSFRVVSNSVITAVVGTGSCGQVLVTTPGGTATFAGFLAVPVITDFSPAIADTGSVVTISGYNFDNASSVSFGESPARSFVVNSPTSISARVALGSCGNVAVTTPGGTAILPGFIAKPFIAAFTPNAGGANSTITIFGGNFVNVSTVKFGGIAAASFIVVDQNTITAVVGPGAPGDITVTTGGGIATITNFLYYVGYIPISPTMTSFTPPSATTGQVVTLNGTNLDSTSVVTFGGVRAQSFSKTITTISAVVGRGASGAIGITTPGGTITRAGFVYTTPPPIVNSFTPAEAGANATVTIKGTNFSGASSVTFGGVAAAGFTVVDSATITAILGTGASGNISITTPGGTGFKAGFLFSEPASISSFSPTNAATGTEVTITGLNLDETSAVSFGGTPAASFNASATSITAVVGSGASGSIEILTPSGPASKSGFTFFINPPTIASFSPTAAFQGTQITIIGTNLNGTTAVSFGGVPATSFNITSSTSVTAVVGPGASGTVSLTTPGGTATRAGFVFNLPGLPTITSFTPDFTGTGGIVNIRGRNLRYPTAVSFGGVPANSYTVLLDTAYYIRATVGQGASGNVSVTTTAGTATKSNFFFFATEPLIVSFSPTSGPTGTSVFIRGKNLGGVTAVTFGGVPAAQFQILTDTVSYIRAVVGNGTTGYITVTNPSGTDSSALPFSYISAGGDTMSICPGSNTVITSNITGSTYQWQIADSTNFTDITNDLIFSSVNTGNIQLTNIPSTLSGKKIRCVVDGVSYSNIINLKFTVTWTGAVNNSWENPANWTCGALPDANTIVFLNYGAVELNSSTTVKSIQISAFATLTVKTGAVLTLERRD